jgi:pilus assembly protein FimV
MILIGYGEPPFVLKRMQIKSKNTLLMLLLLPVLASAAGIGKINVKSALGEPLKAEVEVFVSDSNELDLAVARLGSAQDYADAGIADSYISGVIASIIKKNNGRYAIELLGNQAVNEPYLELLVKLDTKTSNLMRQYTVLLDPPMSALHEEFTQEGPVNFSASENSASKKKKHIDGTKDEKPRTREDSGQSDNALSANPSVDTKKLISAPQIQHTVLGRVTASDETYVAQAGDVFGKIAQRYQPVGVPLVKVMAAFYALNKSAFVDGDQHKLKAGSIIRIPDQESLNNAARIKSAHAEAKQNSTKPSEPLQPVKEPLSPAIREFKLESKPPVSDLVKAEPTAPVDKNVSENPTKGDTNYVLKVSPGDTSISANQPAPTPTTDLAKASKNGTVQSEAAAETSSPSEVNAPAVQPVNKSSNQNGLAAAANTSGADTSFASTLESYWTTIFLVLGLLLVMLLAWFGYSKKRSAVKDLHNHFSPVFGEEILPIESSAPAKPSAYSEPVVSRAFQIANVESHSNPQLHDTLMEEDLKREFSDQPSQLNTKPVDPMIEAELYMTYGRHKQAETILTTVDTPYKLELSLGLLKIYADRKDKAAFERIVHSIHDDLASGSIEDAMIWSKVVALGAKIDPENPLYAGASKVTKLSARERAAAAEKAMQENLMPFDPDASLDLPDTAPAFERLPEISLSEDGKFQAKIDSPSIATDSEQSSELHALDAFEQISAPEKTNEIEFTLEDLKMPELSAKPADTPDASSETTNTDVERGDASALFAKLKDDK